MKRTKRTPEERAAMEQEALSNAVSNRSTRNYYAILAGFEKMGINPHDVTPRENVFTYHAWRALGRQVRKGEHGVRVCTFRSDVVKDKNKDGEKELKVKSRPWFATVFHVSQTDPIEAK